MRLYARNHTARDLLKRFAISMGCGTRWWNGDAGSIAPRDAMPVTVAVDDLYTHPSVPSSASSARQTRLHTPQGLTDASSLLSRPIRDARPLTAAPRD